MIKIITLNTEFGDVKVEVDENRSSSTRGGTFQEKVNQKLDDALDSVKRISESVFKQVGSLPNPPDELNIKLGIKFTSEMGAVIAKASAEGALEVSITWKKNNP